MNKSALIIFVRNTIYGQVKTRLAKTIGNEKALLVYHELLRHTRTISSCLDCDKFVFYSDQIAADDLWDSPAYDKQLQLGDDLGQRMRNAFELVFRNGYEKAVIIGSDCYELDEQKIIKAFKLLETTTSVVGPATDGGYYLLGLTDLIPEIFDNVAWSTSAVCNQTIAILEDLSRSFLLLEPLNDIDEEKDLTVALKDKVGLKQS